MIDQRHFDMMTGGDVALQAEVLGLFEGQAELWARLLIPDAPIPTWRDAAHSIKGSARGLGLWPLAEQCEAVEALARGGQVDRSVSGPELAKARAMLAEALADIAEWRAHRHPSPSIG